MIIMVATKVETFEEMRELLSSSRTINQSLEENECRSLRSRLPFVAVAVAGSYTHAHTRRKSQCMAAHRENFI